MKEETKRKTYLSPQVEVTEIDAREMLCVSMNGGTETPTGGTPWEWENE